MFHKMLDAGEAGDNAGLLLRGLKREDVTRGQVMCKPGAVKPVKKFSASIYSLTKERAAATRPSSPGTARSSSFAPPTSRRRRLRRTSRW